jgi:hypothetical protein
LTWVWLILLGAQVDEPVARWETLLDDRFAAAEQAYAVIYGALRARSIPVAVVADRVRGDGPDRSVVISRLVVVEPHHVMTVFGPPAGASPGPVRDGGEGSGGPG